MTAHEKYDELLRTAVQALTDAARLTTPGLEQADAGEWEPTGPDQRLDWAEFVTLALAGAAANVGGIEPALAGRPGSWEAEGVRQLLQSTVGEGDDGQLWAHRTEPVRFTLHVDSILLDVAPDYWRAYDAAEGEFSARHDAIGIPSFTMTPGMSEEAYRAAADALTPATPEQVDQTDHLNHLAYRLDRQRRAELQAYGEQLRDWITTTMADELAPQLMVVEILIDADTLAETWASVDLDTIEGRYIQRAVEATPTPDQLPGTPLERVEREA